MKQLASVPFLKKQRNLNEFMLIEIDRSKLFIHFFNIIISESHVPEMYLYNHNILIDFVL